MTVKDLKLEKKNLVKQINFLTQNPKITEEELQTVVKRLSDIVEDLKTKI
jgi:hypothetical protein